jgi:acyl-CoA synthetase (NDP forming)
MLSDDTVKELRSFLPHAASVANPVDMLASASPEHFGRATRALLADERVDSLIVIFIPPLVTDPDSVAREIVEGARGAGSKPLLANFMSAKDAPKILESIPTFVFPEAAAAALASVVRYGEWRRSPEGSVPHFDDMRIDDARAVIDNAIARGGGWLSPTEIGKLMDAAGIPYARTVFVESADEAARVAEEVGFPLVLKAAGPAILHKTEAGGVRLGLNDADAVRMAYLEMHSRIGSDMTGAIIQEMISGGVEVVVGATLDPTFGPLVAYGSGGILVELLNDVAFRINPLTDHDVREMLSEVRGTALLRGYRGAPVADEHALTQILLRVSVLLELCPEIHEMDANPVKVLEKGATVLDARVRVARLADPPISRRIAY